MYFRLIAFVYFLVLVSASGEEKTPNPRALSAIKTILLDYDTINVGSTKKLGLQQCSDSNCHRHGYPKCCAIEKSIVWCCPERCLSLDGEWEDCRCFKEDDKWYCAGGVKIVLNVWIIAALTVFNLKQII